MVEGQADSSVPAAWWEVVRAQVADLRFGIVQITVHDGRVVQIDRTERTRLESGGSASSSESVRNR